MTKRLTLSHFHLWDGLLSPEIDSYMEVACSGFLTGRIPSLLGWALANSGITDAGGVLPVAEPWTSAVLWTTCQSVN